LKSVFHRDKTDHKPQKTLNQQRFEERKDKASRHRVKPTTPRPSGIKPKVRCYKCGKLGHISPNCLTGDQAKGEAVRAAHMEVPGDTPSEEETDNKDESEELHSDRTSICSRTATTSNVELVEMETYESSDYGGYDGDHEFLATITEVPLTSTKKHSKPSDNHNLPAQEPHQGRRIQLQVEKGTRLQKQVPMTEKRCISTYVKINGMGAWTLWDSGSTMSGMTPGFAHVAEVVVRNLKDPHLIQLATIGSKSTIKHGANVTMKIGKVVIDDYLDIVNFDHYNLILGAGFVRRNGVILDFKENQIMVQGHQIKGVEWDGETDNCLRQYRMTAKEGHSLQPEKTKSIKGEPPNNQLQDHHKMMMAQNSTNPQGQVSVGLTRKVHSATILACQH
jgi:hypothetical protein